MSNLPSVILVHTVGVDDTGLATKFYPVLRTNEDEWASRSLAARYRVKDDGYKVYQWSTDETGIFATDGVEPRAWRS